VNLLRHVKVFALIFYQTALFLLIVFHCAVSGLIVKFLFTVPVGRFLAAVRGKLMHCLCPHNPVMWASFQGFK
jgi:ABC-type branched-subunit amino acid transport system permease subunit